MGWDGIGLSFVFVYLPLFCGICHSLPLFIRPPQCEYYYPAPDLWVLCGRTLLHAAIHSSGIFPPGSGLLFWARATGQQDELEAQALALGFSPGRPTRTPGGETVLPSS